MCALESLSMFLTKTSLPRSKNTLTVVVNFGLVCSTEALGLQRCIIHLKFFYHSIVEFVPFPFIRIAQVRPPTNHVSLCAELDYDSLIFIFLIQEICAKRLCFHRCLSFFSWGGGDLCCQVPGSMSFQGLGYLWSHVPSRGLGMWRVGYPGAVGYQGWVGIPPPTREKTKADGTHPTEMLFDLVFRFVLFR